MIPLGPPDIIRFYLLEDGREQLVQYFSGTGVHCGFESPAMDYIQDPIDLYKELIPSPSTTFVIDVIGKSMTKFFVADPAKLVIDRSVPVANEDLVLVVINREFMVRQYIKENGVITLYPGHRDYPPIVMTEGIELELWGVVTHILVNTRVAGLKRRLA